MSRVLMHITASLALALTLALLPAQGVTHAAPAEYPTEGRWIYVDLTHLRAIAYVGRTPVYGADITAGEDGWETPRGDYEILYRVYNETMTSDAFGLEPDDPGGWYYEDVYFTQYFNTEGDALHYNWWIEDWKFGEVRDSGGCIGLRWDAAQYFWHFASEGTPVIIR